MRLSAVIFDMDGLMIDTEALIKPCFQRAAAEMGCDIDDNFYQTLIGSGYADTAAALTARFGDSLRHDEFSRRLAALFRDRIDTSGIPVKTGVHDLIAMLDRHRLPKAIATSTEFDDAEFSLRTAGLWGHFDVIVCGDHVSRGKPHPDIYLLAASRLGVDPRECLVFEDSNAGVLAASRAGMRVVLVPDVCVPSEDAVNAAYRVLPSLTEAAQLIAPWLGH
jgi:HAD superfamily hydrolase (TIGR01509 family)